MTAPVTELVRKAATGDLGAFGSLVSALRDMVYGTVLALTGNTVDAQDVAQEVFIQAWRDLGSLRDLDRFPAWLYKIARHRSLDFMRKQRPVTQPLDRESPGALHSPQPSPDKAAQQAEVRQMVHAAIRSPSEPNRLKLRACHGRRRRRRPRSFRAWRRLCGRR